MRKPNPARIKTASAAKISVRLADKAPRPANNSGLKPAVMIASARADHRFPQIRLQQNLKVIGLGGRVSKLRSQKRVARA